MSTTEKQVNSGRELMKGRGGSGKGLVFFDRHELPDILVEGAENLIEVPDSIRENVDLASYFENTTWFQPLVVQPEANGFSLVAYRFAPNHTTPRHYHDGDQIVFVLEGEVRLGNRKLGPGTGYFTAAGQTYSITAGPEGARIMEFRSVTEFRTVFVEDKPERWGAHDEASEA